MILEVNLYQCLSRNTFKCEKSTILAPNFALAAPLAPSVTLTVVLDLFARTEQHVRSTMRASSGSLAVVGAR